MSEASADGGGSSFSNDMITANQLLYGIVATTCVVGAYFVGLFQGQRHSVPWLQIVNVFTSRLTLRGVVWSAVLPAVSVLLYYSFVAHVWFSLGRWPEFGEQLRGALILFHEVATRQLFVAMIGSLFVAPLVVAGCLSDSRWRHVSIYVLCYSAAVGSATGAVFLAPEAFLNWLLD